MSEVEELDDLDSSANHWSSTGRLGWKEFQERDGHTAWRYYSIYWLEGGVERSMRITLLSKPVDTTDAMSQRKPVHL